LQTNAQVASRPPAAWRRDSRAIGHVTPGVMSAVCQVKQDACSTMEELIGKTIEIAGMVIEIESDDGENWQCRNLTTREPLAMKKAVIERAIKLGQAELLPGRDGHRD
jgi:hypothetical protein